MGSAQTVPLSDYVMLLVAIMGVAVATSIGVKVTGQSRVGCHESVLGLAGRVRGNWVGEVRQCYGIVRDGARSSAAGVGEHWDRPYA